MKYIYTAIFSPIPDNKGYYARVPDLPGCITTGKSISDAIDQITDAMNAWLVVAEDENLEIKAASPQHNLEHAENVELAFIKADTTEYRAKTDKRAVRKNVSLPAWMLYQAEKNKINCSKVLQDALMEMLSS